MQNKFIWCFVALFCTTVIGSAIGHRDVDIQKTSIKKSYERDFEPRDYNKREDSAKYDEREYELSENHWDDDKHSRRMKEKHKKDHYKRNHKDNRDFIDDNWDKYERNSNDDKYYKKNKGEKAKKYWKSDEHRSDKRHYKQKKYDQELRINMKDDEITPPDHKKYIAMARYVVHTIDWCSIATISTLPAIKGFPFANIASMSDGPVDNSTGIPYFYLTDLDFSSKDMMRDNRCTVTVTLAQTDYCNDMDPQDPRCARVIISGRISPLLEKFHPDEYAFAKNALFSRHPSMATLPEDHKFYVAKMDMTEIALLDWFGGAKFLSVPDYLKFKEDCNSENYEAKQQISDIKDNHLSPSVIQA